MKTQLSQSRRQFLQRTAAAGAGLLLTPLAMPAARSRSASERITVGMIGIGAMGRGHLDRLLGYEDVQVVAVCDVEKTRRETAQSQVEKRYAARQKDGVFKGCDAYIDFRDLIARKDIDAVVVATDATTAAGLVSAGATAGPVWRSVTCLYFAAARSPLGESIIALNGTGSGLVNNVCVPSDLAPDYAPPGQALVSVSVLGTVDSADLESRVLAELEAWFGGAVREWRHLRTYRIERALPRQAPGTGFTGPSFRQAAGVYLCGDHLWSTSIEGAIISGLRTADAILMPT